MAILRTPLRCGVITLLLLALCPLASAQDAHTDVDRLVQDANDRVTRGESQEAVEQGLRKDLDRQGLQARTAPPEWDVFARASWEQGQTNNDQESQQGKTIPTPSAPFVVTTEQP